eukprot:364111-Chlamydomonas_euryale.AAC.12
MPTNILPPLSSSGALQRASIRPSDSERAHIRSAAYATRDSSKAVSCRPDSPLAKPHHRRRRGEPSWRAVVESMISSGANSRANADAFHRQHAAPCPPPRRSAPHRVAPYRSQL